MPPEFLGAMIDITPDIRQFYRCGKKERWMKLGYVRLSPAGPPLEYQLAAQRNAGVHPSMIMLDDHRSGAPYAFEGRSLLLFSLKTGDELVVAAASRLGVGLDDVLGVLAEVARRGASVFDVEADRRFTWHPDAAGIVDFARQATSAVRLEVVAKMQRGRVLSERLGGPRLKLEGDRLERARRLWEDPSNPAEAIAGEMGVSVRTLYRRFGNRT